MNLCRSENCTNEVRRIQGPYLIFLVKKSPPPHYGPFQLGLRVKNVVCLVFPGGGLDSEKSDVGKRVKDQVFATIALKKGASSKNEVSCVTYYTVTYYSF